MMVKRMAAPNTEPNIMPRRVFVGRSLPPRGELIGAAAAVGVEVVLLDVSNSREVLDGVADDVLDVEVDVVSAANTF
jgi:hypothetical protein